MKRIIICLAACFSCFCATVKAQTVTVADVEVVPGTTASFTINLSGGKANTYTSLQYNVTFPKKGFTTTGDCVLNTTAWKGVSATIGDVDSEGLAIIPVSSANELTSGDVENLMSVDFKVASDVALGSYEVKLSKITFGYGFTDKDVAPDVTFNVKVVDALTVKLDENATEAPKAAAGVNVNVKRTIAAKTWSTGCFPFAMTAEQVKTAFGDNVKLGEVTGSNPEEDDDGNIVAISVGFKSISEIEANRPFIIWVEDAVSEFTVEGVDIAPESDPELKVGSGKKRATMYGTYVANTIVPEENLFLNGGKFWYSKGTTTIKKAFRGYFEFKDPIAAYEEAPSRINITFDDITGIKSLNTDNGEEIYTLSGQRVEKAGKGVYIVNGKKVIKK
jgi:desulfoferrodoxin (superoxide reductase-like protein)